MGRWTDEDDRREQPCRDVRSFAATVPFFAAALVLAFGLSILLASTLARRLGMHRSVAALLVFGVGLVIAATLTPTRDAFAGAVSAGVCDTSRMGMASLDELTRISQASLNVLLFIPLGLAVGLLPRTRSASLIAAGAFSLTFVVEGLQLVVTVLGRGCETADIFDNLLGLAIGIGTGILLRALLQEGRGGPADLTRPRG